MISHGSLKRITLNYFGLAPNNQYINPPSALSPSVPKTDHLSLVIHTMSLSERVTHLDLGDHIVISPSLFWPDTQSKQPSWPNLVFVKVDFSMNTADGEWYFVRDPDTSGESDDDDDAITDTSSADGSELTTYQDPDPDVPDTYNEKKVALAIGAEPICHFRSKADPDKLDPLFKAAAQAAAQMPRLQRMTLRTEVKAFRNYVFSMNYFAPGERAGRGAGSRNVDKPRLDWVIGPSGYEPTESILEIWREAKGDIVQSVSER